MSINGTRIKERTEFSDVDWFLGQILVSHEANQELSKNFNAYRIVDKDNAVSALAFRYFEILAELANPENDLAQKPEKNRVESILQYKYGSTQKFPIEFDSEKQSIKELLKCLSLENLEGIRNNFNKFQRFVIRLIECKFDSYTAANYSCNQLQIDELIDRSKLNLFLSSNANAQFSITPFIYASNALNLKININDFDGNFLRTISIPHSKLITRNYEIDLFSIRDSNKYAILYKRNPEFIDDKFCAKCYKVGDNMLECQDYYHLSCLVKQKKKEKILINPSNKPILCKICSRNNNTHCPVYGGIICTYCKFDLCAIFCSKTNINLCQKCAIIHILSNTQNSGTFTCLCGVSKPLTSYQLKCIKCNNKRFPTDFLTLPCDTNIHFFSCKSCWITTNMPIIKELCDKNHEDNILSFDFSFIKNPLSNNSTRDFGKNVAQLLLVKCQKCKQYSFGSFSDNVCKNKCIFCFKCDYNHNKQLKKPKCCVCGNKLREKTEAWIF